MKGSLNGKWLALDRKMFYMRRNNWYFELLFWQAEFWVWNISIFHHQCITVWHIKTRAQWNELCALYLCQLRTQALHSIGTHAVHHAFQFIPAGDQCRTAVMRVDCVLPASFHKSWRLLSSNSNALTAELCKHIHILTILSPYYTTKCMYFLQVVWLQLSSLLYRLLVSFSSLFGFLGPKTSKFSNLHSPNSLWELHLLGRNMIKMFFLLIFVCWRIRHLHIRYTR